MSRKNHTMAEFHAEMKRRGINNRSFEKGYLRRPAKPAPKPKTERKPRVHTCAIHPLHTVKINADGSRSGCDFCDDYIRDLCRLFQLPSTSQDQTD